MHNPLNNDYISDSQWLTNSMISYNQQNIQRYTLNEWNLNNRHRFEFTVNLQQSTEDLLAKSDQLEDIVKELAQLNKEETDHCLKEKIKDVEFRKKELLHVREQVVDEYEQLDSYKNRLEKTLASVDANFLDICNKCLTMREHRIGIDLVNDYVKKELLQEFMVIQECKFALEKLLKETKEQLRKLKASLYFIDSDICEKTENINNSQKNLNLKKRNVNLQSVKIFSCNQSQTTEKEWECQTIKNIKEILDAMKSSKLIRNCIDNTIKEVINDLTLQQYATDKAFLRRINETKEQKSKLESYHAEVAEKADKMKKNVVRLEKLIVEKEGFLALAQTRYNNNCKLSLLENTLDSVQKKLVKEIGDINEILKKLHETLAEAQASLQLLLKTQIQLEEDINIKINTLKIDEVDCMTLRYSIDFHGF